MRTAVFPRLFAKAGTVLIPLAVAVLVNVCPVDLQAQQVPDRLSPALQAAIVDSVAASLIQTYIFLETAEEMAGFIRSRVAAGGYDDHAAPQDFTRQLTADLQSISHDLHLRVNVRQPAPASAEPIPVEEQIRRRNESLRRENYRFQKVETTTSSRQNWPGPRRWRP